MSTETKVIEVIAQTLESSPEEISSSDRFVEDLGVNSLDIVNLIWRIEEAFSLPETPDSALEDIEKVEDLVDLVDRTRSGEPSEAQEVADFVLAADHAGVEMKAMLQQFLHKKGLAVVDLGPADTHSVDYPDFAELLARQVASGQANAGILVCGSGIGMSIAANKVAGVRAALVTNPLMASLSRQHNNANILCLGSRLIGPDMAKACVDSFMSTDFDPGDDGRHQRRVGRISEIERNTEC